LKLTETKLKGSFVIEPEVFEDSRGHFFESYHQQKFEDAIGQQIDFVQDNQSMSKQGVLRGLHFQNEQYAQSKLVRVIAGEVLDVIVDLRTKSETFGQHFKLRLSAENQKMIFIPKGMAHGFLTLTKSAIFSYKCDTYYHPAAENGIVYNDESLKIDWEYPSEKIILSQKDTELLKFKEVFK
jgi:dTDP-4-dehydrorhamnose 3,5-epimerase